MSGHHDFKMSQKYPPLDELPSMSDVCRLDIPGEVTLYYGWEFKTKQLIRYLSRIGRWPDSEYILASGSPLRVDGDELTDSEYHSYYSGAVTGKFRQAIQERYKIAITEEFVVYTGPYTMMFALWSNCNMKIMKGTVVGRRLDTGVLALEALGRDLRKEFADHGDGEAGTAPKWYWASGNQFV